MTSRRSNNVKRAEWNKRCREELSAHIYNKLGITIEATQVRLKTNANDPYAWERMEEKEHLFSKNLSDLSTGQLKELCSGINKSFAPTYKRPVVSSHQKPDQDASFLEVVEPELNFVAKIDELHRDNHRLACEIRNW
ncbi:hypothetical protein N7G274_010908 [Stereocaulon virgatum]|uniref:Uncharacterized protein n=1 Tax=Stereocaulon virgatum TaxID=373712 RepID=A0ABR3ZUM9_9LECA